MAPTTSTASRPWLTQDEAAEYLQVTRRTLDRYRAAGLLTAYKIGPRAVRFRAEDLDALARPVSGGESIA